MDGVVLRVRVGWTVRFENIPFDEGFYVGTGGYCAPLTVLLPVSYLCKRGAVTRCCWPWARDCVGQQHAQGLAR